MSRNGSMSRQGCRLSDEFSIEVIHLKGIYVRHSEKRRLIIDGAETCSVEEYACRHFRSLGYNTLIVGNAPIWVLFGVYMSPLIQDAKDSHIRRVMVGSKFFPEKHGQIVEFPLPEDFGKPGYGIRRGDAIKKHLSTINGESGRLWQLFDSWLGPSEDLRQYLWAIGNEHVQVARQLINIFPAVKIAEILQYLIEDYWERRSGWPGLLAYRQHEALFADVKPASGKLAKSKQRWLRDNRERLHFPFKMIEVIRAENGPVAA